MALSEQTFPLAKGSKRGMAPRIIRVSCGLSVSLGTRRRFSRSPMGCGHVKGDDDDDAPGASNPGSASTAEPKPQAQPTASTSAQSAAAPSRVEAMRAKIKAGGHDSPYRLRKQLPEPVFGQIKEARG